MVDVTADVERGANANLVLNAVLSDVAPELKRSFPGLTIIPGGQEQDRADAEHRHNAVYLDGRVIEAGCNAHVRRKLRDAEAVQGGQIRLHPQRFIAGIHLTLAPTREGEDEARRHHPLLQRARHGDAGEGDRGPRA